MFSRRLSTTTNPKNVVSALSVFKNSCYNKIDFKINEDNTANNAVKRFAAFNIGCLAVTDNHNNVIGVLSERDYINKISAVGKDDMSIKVKDICTYTPNIIIAKKNDSIEECMNKMLFKDIRHLLVIDDNNKNDVIGMISIKDLIKEVMKDKNDIITRLTDFKIGKGGYFGSE
jgi:CBS domain-containing protein|uniref:CBS domain-containing protein n=1 Tax=viral metagenome TaxID=1070528 RepID=A0A6C0I030_9ZZZZ